MENLKSFFYKLISFLTFFLFFLVANPSHAKAGLTYFGSIAASSGFHGSHTSYWNNLYFGFYSRPRFYHSYKAPALLYWSSSIPAIERQIAYKKEIYLSQNQQAQNTQVQKDEKEIENFQKIYDPEIHINPKETSVIDSGSVVVNLY